jgi:four helix bundle protein
VYRSAFALADRLFVLSRAFPREERYALTDQLRRSSRSVCANLAEAWRKRRYRGAFISKLSDAEAEAAETQCWIDFALRCGYLPETEASELQAGYDDLLRGIVGMIHHADRWLITPS